LDTLAPFDTSCTKGACVGFLYICVGKTFYWLKTIMKKRE